MKRVTAICLLCLLSACASTENKSYTKSQPQRQLSNSEYDEVYMARVQRQARQFGVSVKWVSPPRAPKAKKDGQ